MQIYDKPTINIYKDDLRQENRTESNSESKTNDRFATKLLVSFG